MDAPRMVTAGLVGTAVMTVLMLAGPMMGFPELNIGQMLGSFLGIGTALGWVMHFVIGVTLAGIYVLGAVGMLPGHVAVRGAVYGFVVFLVAQIVVTPIMGGRVFSGGDIPMIMGSLFGHLVYGALVGLVYGQPERPIAQAV